MSEINFGCNFENEVARWVKKQWEGYVLEVIPDDRARGTLPNAYQVDVHLIIHGFSGRHVWIECKWRTSRHVEKEDVITLVGKAADVYRARQVHLTNMYYHGLIVVSNAGFGRAALEYANTWDVWCITLNESRAYQENCPEAWLDSPAWLKRAMAVN